LNIKEKPIQGRSGRKHFFEEEEEEEADSVFADFFVTWIVERMKESISACDPDFITCMEPYACRGSVALMDLSSRSPPHAELKPMMFFSLLLTIDVKGSVTL
jgi:hypothetical protein